MAQAKPTTRADSDAAVLRLTRRFAAPREAVFRAFTDRAEFKKWWGPKGFTCAVAEGEARPGSRYHVEMCSPEGNVHCLDGEFREVTPPERLVYTWTWDRGNFAGVETLVTLEFRDAGGETELRLTHEMLPGERARELHEQGWSGSFDCLEIVLKESDRP